MIILISKSSLTQEISVEDEFYIKKNIIQINRKKISKELVILLNKVTQQFCITPSRFCLSVNNLTDISPYKYKQYNYFCHVEDNDHHLKINVIYLVSLD